MLSRLCVHFFNFRFLSVVVIFITGMIVYAPSLRIGFWYDDYRLVDLAGRLPLTDYLRLWFDPRLPLFPFYRPIKG